MPPIHYNTPQPAGSNACGAYALAACLTAFHRKPQAAFELDYAVPGTAIRRRAFIPSGASPDVFGRQIYAVTGLLDMNPGTAPGNAQYRKEPNFFNAPSAMTWVARQLGCTVTVNVLNAVFPFLNAAFPNEVPMIQAAGGVVQQVAAYAAPAPHELQILLVSHNTHWIARDSNGHYYDPATGQNNLAWGDPNGPALTIGPHPPGYTLSGMWLTIT